MKEHVLDWVAFTLQNKTDVLLCSSKEKISILFPPCQNSMVAVMSILVFHGKKKKSKEKQAVITYGKIKLSKEINQQEKRYTSANLDKRKFFCSVLRCTFDVHLLDVTVF